MEKTAVHFDGVFCSDSSGGDTAVRFVFVDGSKQWFALSKADALDMAETISSMYARLTEMEGSDTSGPSECRQEVPEHRGVLVRLLNTLRSLLGFGSVSKSCGHV